MPADLDPRRVLLSKLDLAVSRVEFSTSPIVLLCGGPVETKVRADDPDPPIRSLRHGITKSHTKYEIFRPEEIPTWQSDGVYKDLMSFELDLASICTLVVIILESEGALAELGAFSQLPYLNRKIVAVRSSKYADDTSFINLGILRHISANHRSRSSVLTYPWDTEKPQEIPLNTVSDVVSDIQTELDKLKKSQVANINDDSHIMVFICEVIDIFAALKEIEIHDFITTLGSEITKDELKRKLFLLKEFRLIKSQIYSDATFYLRSKEPYHKLRLAIKDKKGPFDELRERTEILDYYKNDTKHKNRIRAIAESSKGNTK